MNNFNAQELEDLMQPDNSEKDYDEDDDDDDESDSELDSDIKPVRKKELPKILKDIPRQWLRSRRHKRGREPSPSPSSSHSRKRRRQNSSDG